MTRRLGDYGELTALAGALRPRVAIVLGSGLNELADRLEDAVELPFAAAPDLDGTQVPGHRGALLLGKWAGLSVLILAGRLHHYEGHPWRRVVQPIHIAHALGAPMLLATNAAGGIRADLAPGDLMAIRAHIDWTRTSWWRTSPATTRTPYSERWTRTLQQAAEEAGCSLATGVYAQMTGPCYETPAEIRALRSIGADAVGMSTVREIETAYELGMECAAISCITNKAAGLGAGEVNHQEVLETGRAAQEKLGRLIEAVLRGMESR